MDNNLNNSIQHIQGTDIIAKTYSIINENFDLLWSVINSLRPDKESVNNVNIEWLGGDNVGIPGRVYSNINDNDKKYIGTVDTMKYATPSKPGLLSVTDQQIGGNKKFNDGIAISSGENKGITAKIGTKSIEIINVVSNRGGGYTVSLGGSKVTSGVSPIQLVYNANGALVNVIVTGANGTSTSFKPDEYFEHITSGLNQFLLDKESEMMSKLTDSLVNALGADNIDFIDGFSNNYFENSTDAYFENGDLKDECANNLIENGGSYEYNANHIRPWITVEDDNQYQNCINDVFHVGDTLTLKDLRKCYRYKKLYDTPVDNFNDNDIYWCGWEELTADDYPTVVAALLAALDAQSTVDGKQSIFYGRPKTEYGIKYSYGDTWIINDDDIYPYVKDSSDEQGNPNLKSYFDKDGSKFTCYDRTYDRTEGNNDDKKLYDVYESGGKYYIMVGDDDYLTKDETLFCDALNNDDEPYNIDQFDIDHWNSKMMNVGNLNSKLEDIINALTSQSDKTVSIWNLSDAPIPNVDKLGLNIVRLNEGDEITKPWTENSDSGDDNDSDHIGDICIISNSYDRQWVFTQSGGEVSELEVGADYYWKETEVDISTMMSKLINDKFGDKIQPFLDGQLNIFAASSANEIGNWEHKSGDILVNISKDTITACGYNFKPGSFYMCNYNVKNKKHSGSEHANTTDDETWILLTDYDSIIEKAMENTSLKDIIVNLYNERFDAYNTAYYIKYVTDKLNNLPEGNGSIRYIFDFSDGNNVISENYENLDGNVYSKIKKGEYKIYKDNVWKTIQESISPDIITALVKASQTKESFEGDTNGSNIGEIVVYSYKGGEFSNPYKIGDLIYVNVTNSATTDSFKNNGVYVCISSKKTGFNADDWKKLPDDNSSLINLNLTNQKDNVVNYWYGTVGLVEGGTDNNALSGDNRYKPWSTDEFIYPDEYYIGDFYICTEKIDGEYKCWIYGKTLEWIEIEDLEKYPSVKTIVDGMNNSAALDGVRRNFIGRPDKYSAGDTWLVTAADISSPNGYGVSKGYILKSGEPLGKENDVLISTNDNDSFEISDWVNVDSTKDITNILEQITNLSNQLDNEVTYWYGDVDLVEGDEITKPWTENSDSGDDNDSDHIGDIYVNENTKNCYRFEEDGTSYKWVLLDEKDYPIALKSLIKAIGAVETADGKVNVYTSIPIKIGVDGYKKFEVGGNMYYDAKKYGIGDMWIVSVDDCNNADFTEGMTNLRAEINSVLICIANPTVHENTDGIHYEFSFANWENVSRKINPSEELAEYISKVNALENQIDNKVNYWFGTTQINDDNKDNITGHTLYQPWGAGDNLDDHVKDIYTYYDKLYPKNSKCYIFEKDGGNYSWNEFNESFSEVLKKMAVVEETVDGVISVFNGAPTEGNYGFGDLWVVSEDDIEPDGSEYYTSNENNTGTGNNDNLSTHIFSHGSYKINVKQNDILVCCNSNDDKSFDLSDWQNMRDRASIDGLYNTISSLETQIDNKVNYWFGTTPIGDGNRTGNSIYKPWGDIETDLKLYVGDYYVYNGEKCYRFIIKNNIYEWEDVTNSGANSAFIQSLLNSWRTSAALDNVISIYTKCPIGEDYKYGDRWIISDDDFDTTNNNNGVIGNGVINTPNGYYVNDKNEIYYVKSGNETIIGKVGDEVICITTKDGGFKITDWMNFGTYVATLDEVQDEIKNNIKDTITGNYITNILTSVDLDELRNQLDKTISYWFGIDEISNSRLTGTNIYKQWSDDNKNHIGDIYICTTTRKCWKLKKISDEIKWKTLSKEESEIITRLIGLEEVNDNQINIFWSVPFDKKYSKGDMWYISESDVTPNQSDTIGYYSRWVIKDEEQYELYKLEESDDGYCHIVKNLDDGKIKDYGGVGNVLICGKDKGEIFSISDWITMTEYLNQNTGINLSEINQYLKDIQSSLTGSDGIVTYYYSTYSPIYDDDNKPRRPWKTPGIDANNENCGKSENTDEDANHNKDVWVRYVSDGNHITYEFIVSNGVGKWEETTSSDNTFTIINKIISTYHLDDVQKALADGTRNIFVGSVKDFLDKTENTDTGNTGHGFGDIWYFNKSDFKETDNIGEINTIDGHSSYSIEKIEDGEKVIVSDNSKDFKLNCLYYCNHDIEGNHKLSKCIDKWINIGDFDKIRKEIKDINSTLEEIKNNADIATSLSNLIGNDSIISPIEKVQIKSLWEKIVGQPGGINFNTNDNDDKVEKNKDSFDITFYGSSKDALDAIAKNNFVFGIDNGALYEFDSDNAFINKGTTSTVDGDKFVINLLNSLYYLNEFLWGTPGIMKESTTTILDGTDGITIPGYIYSHCGLNEDNSEDKKKVLSSLFSTYYSAEQAIYTHISGETYNKANEAYEAAQNAGLTAFDVMDEVVNAGDTEINGGLMLTNLIAMGDPGTKEITGGLSGVKDDRVGLFFGSTYEDAYNSANWDSINSKMNELLYKKSTLPTGQDLEASESEKLRVLQNIVNNGKPEIPVLITKDGYGSNIGGCYLDDRQMFMVPVDNIDGEVTVSKLTVDKDTRTSKDAEASVSPDSFKIRYGNAFINMGIKNNIPYITGVDGNGNIRFNLGGIEDNIATLEPCKIGGSIYLDDIESSDGYYSGVNGIEDNSLVRCNLPSFKLNNLTDEDLYIDSITYKYKIGNYNRYYEFEVKHVGKNGKLTVSDESPDFTYNVEKIKYYDTEDSGKYDESKNEYTPDENDEQKELYIVRSIADGGFGVLDVDVVYVEDEDGNEVPVKHIFNPDDELYTSVNDVNVYEYVPYRTTPFIFNTDSDISHRGSFPSVDALSGEVAEGTYTYSPKSGKELQRILYTNYYPFFGQIELKKKDDNKNTYLYRKETPNTVYKFEKLDFEEKEYIYNSAEYHKGELSLYAPNTYHTLCKVCQNGNENKMKESILKFHENGILNSMFPIIRDASVEVKVYTGSKNITASGEVEYSEDYKEQTLYYSWEDKVFDVYRYEYNEEATQWEWKIIKENPDSDKVVSASISSFNYISKSEFDKLKQNDNNIEDGYVKESYSNYSLYKFVNVGEPPTDGVDPHQTKRFYKDETTTHNGKNVFKTWAEGSSVSSSRATYVKLINNYLLNKLGERTDIKLNTYNENDEILYPFFTLLFRTYKNGEYKNRLITVIITYDDTEHYIMYPHTVNGDGLIVFSDERNRSSSDDFEFNNAIYNDTLNINYGDVVQFKFKFNKDINCGDYLENLYYTGDVVDDNVGLVFKNFNGDNTFDWSKITDASPLKSTLTVRVGSNVSTSTVTLRKVSDEEDGE